MLALLSKKMMMALSFVFGMLTLFFGYVIMFNLDKPENQVNDSNIKRTIVNDCKEKAISLGFTNNEYKSINNLSANSLTLYRVNVKDPMELAIKTSNLQNYCKKMELNLYCLGNDCGTFEGKSIEFKMNLKLN